MRDHKGRFWVRRRSEMLCPLQHVLNNDFDLKHGNADLRVRQVAHSKWQAYAGQSSGQAPPPRTSSEYISRRQASNSEALTQDAQESIHSAHLACQLSQGQQAEEELTSSIARTPRCRHTAGPGTAATGRPKCGTPTPCADSQAAVTEPLG